MYEQQQQADAAGVRSVAGFIAELSDRWYTCCSASTIAVPAHDSITWHKEQNCA